MFDIGWTELLVIAVVLIVVVGPKDLPPMLRAFGKMTQRAKRVASDFRAQFDEALREADMNDLRETLSDAQKLNPVNSLREAMNPLRQMGNDIKADLQKATRVDTPQEHSAAPLSGDAEPTPLSPPVDLGLPETQPIVAPSQNPPQSPATENKAPSAPVHPTFPVAASPGPADVAPAPKPARKPRVASIPAADAVPPAKVRRSTSAKAAIGETAVGETSAKQKRVSRKPIDQPPVALVAAAKKPRVAAEKKTETAAKKDEA